MSTARELTNRLADLLAKEHGAMADFLIALADFDQRRAWSELGYAGLFDFLHRELGLSKGAAHFRKVAAQLVQAFPEIVEPLRDGRLCLSSVIEIAKVLTPENRGEVLPRFFHRSRREAMEVAAEIRPMERPPVGDAVTAVRKERVAGAETALRAVPVSTGESGGPVLLAELPHASSQRPPQESREVVVPLTADLRRLGVTVSRRFLAKLDAARDALSHSHPGATTEEILEAGLDLVLARHAKRRGLVEKPRSASRPSAPDHIPAQVKREVWTRARGKCEAPLASGGVCGSTRRLELHHVVPLARGGPSTPGNVRLLCDVHHDRESRAFFGDECMDRFARRGKARQTSDPGAAPPP